MPIHSTIDGREDEARILAVRPAAPSSRLRGAFHRALPAWYARVRRDLPWRRTRDPYAIVVSEFMLQQTQVATVVPFYRRWMARFPDWNSLAAASVEEVVKAWEGLGYYTRARNLHKLANVVAGPLGGVLPPETEALRRLPGIGPYTAGAIASLALGRRASLIDGNVIRVLARVFAVAEDVGLGATRKRLWEIADTLLPEAAACAGHNSSLMELGALVCTPARPDCRACPLGGVCRARPNPELFPRKAPKVIERVEEEIAVIARGGRYWCEPGPKKGRLVGFWRFPALDEGTMDRGGKLADFHYSITRYRVRLTGWRACFRTAPPTEGRWCSLAEMEALAMPSAHRRLRESLK